MLHDMQRTWQRQLLDGGTAPADVLAARFAIYGNTVRASLTEALAASFPVTAQLVGEDFFAGAAARFIRAAPPRQAVLHRYGADFPAFLAGIAGTPVYVPDVARLEWLMIESLLADEDTARITPALLAAAGTEDPVFRCHPSLRVAAFAHAAAAIWRAHQPDGPALETVDPSESETVVLIRRGTAVALRIVGSGQGAFLAALMDGLGLEAAIGRGFAAEPGFDAAGALADAVGAGYVTRLVTTGEPSS